MFCLAVERILESTLVTHLVEMHQAEYEKAEKFEKTAIAERIIGKSVTTSPGREQEIRFSCRVHSKFQY